MTSRLKRKLNDLGVDTSSSKANESFCLIGTPLPPLEKSKDLGEFVPLWKQEVRDEKGRRRLHGAFTGGFSAGYFNTVGSAEGWAPSTFVSSRSDRAKAKAARPEDFMDEEDLQELRESRTLVDTTEEMDFTGGTAAELKRKGVSEEDSEQDSITQALQSTLLPSPNESVGAKILKKMGWKLGSGIGPRITLRQSRLQDLQASSQHGARAITSEDVKITEDDDEANKHTYAPRDTPVWVVDRKDNAHGIGYSPGMSLHESHGHGGSGKGGSGKGLNIAAGFGLGALNDADEDDLDVYDADMKSSRNRVAWDANHNDDFVLGGRSKTSSRPDTSKGTSSTTFRDGIRVLTGFTLSEKPVMEDRWFPVPEIPPGWKPDPGRVWELEGNKENIPRDREEPKLKSEPISHEKWKSSGMTADERGNMLGETPVNKGPRSVFEYLSSKDRERLQNIANATASGIPISTFASSTSTSVPTASTSTPFIPIPTPTSTPRLESHIAEAALKGFQPFTSDPSKQARYTTFLRSQIPSSDNDSKSNPTLKPLPNQKPDEFYKEIQDYIKSATIFKPISRSMAGRFQTAHVIENGPKVYEGLYQPTIQELEVLEEERKKKEEEEEKERLIDPSENAARLGMFGMLTRNVRVWRPNKLLCKRFGLKEPDIVEEEEDVAGAGDGDGDGVTTGAGSGFGPSFTTSNSTLDSNFGSSSSAATDAGMTSGGPRNLANVGLGEDEYQGRDTLTYQRPTMDVFKAIFASDDEDSDDDEKEEEEDRSQGQKELEKQEQEQEQEQKVVPIPSATLLDNGPVDLSNFKPTFIPRGGKKEKEKKKEKKKKDKKAGGLSFVVDEEGVEGLSLNPSKERPKKKKKKLDDKNTEKREDEDVGMWDNDNNGVTSQAKEAKVPLLVVPTPVMDGVEITTPSVAAASAAGTGANIHRGRKRAIDFL